MNRINLARVIFACGLRYGRTVRGEKQRAEGNPMLGAPLRCRRRLRRSSLLLASVLWLATAVQPSHGQIILDGPNVSGNVGLNGVTHGSAFVQFIWSGGSSFQSLPSGDTEYLMRVEPDQVLRAFVSLSSIAGGTNASLVLDKRNITGPLSTATEPLNLDLRRDPGGRIIGRVTVTGGTVQRINLNTLTHLIAPDEFFRGNANANNGADVILPYVAAPSVGVRGSATLIAAAGCSVPVSLANQTVEVPSSGDVVVSWNFDLSSEECLPDLTGSIQGTITRAGLDGANNDVVFRTGIGTQISVFGPNSKTQSGTILENYLLTDLIVGNWRVRERNWFNAPYERIDWPQTSTFSLGAGETVTKDFARSMGTLHGAIQPTGAWNLSDISSMFASGQSRDATTNAFQGSIFDRGDVSTGNFDFVVPIGKAFVTNYNGSFRSINDGKRFNFSSFSHSFTLAPRPFEATVNAGDRITLPPFEPVTSQALQVFQIADPTVGIKTFRLSGSTRIRNELGQQIEFFSVFNGSTALGGTIPENSIGILVRGIPGTYTMTATAQGTDGGSYRARFEFVLGSPENTPPGTDVENPIEIVNETTGETTTGSITFGEVTTGGETTVSASGTGPLAPGDFRIFGTGTQLYFDVQSTAKFDTAKVCFGYDDTEFQTVQQEKQLTLQHEVCTDPETQTGCKWFDITLAGYPDTDANMICGETDSFSIFALMLPLDDDSDGIPNAEDNCKATPNPDQTDTDGDGIGNACEVDSDNDGIDDDADNCLLTPNPNQSDLDSDGLGDVCDSDIDGDTVLNGNDNCELIANTSQADFDGDTLGDACDPDADNDTVENGLDSCPGTPPEVLISADGCSSEQLLEQQCPSDGDYRNHGQYVSCVADEANRQVDDGLITKQEKGAIISTSAKSDIGKK